LKRPVKKEVFSFISTDAVKIKCYRWYVPKNRNTASVIIIHGMADHFNRYDSFATSLCLKGLKVYGIDLRGHGHTVKGPMHYGHLSDSLGWEKTVNDIKRLLTIVKNNNKQKPVFLFAHSLGELLVRDFMIDNSHDINGAILSGVAANPGIIKYLGKLVADLLVFFKGKRYKSVFLTNMLFGKYNDSFKPTRTNCDWISSIGSEVDKYIEDPFCNIIFTAGFFQDLNNGFNRINDIKNIKKIRKDLPVMLLAGKEDAVGNRSLAVIELYETYKKIGMTDTSYKLYDGVRHEIVNDISRDIVINDITGWIKRHS